MNERDQIAGLLALQRIVGAYEVNSVLNPAPSDVAYVAAMDVPDASEVCYASGKGYDVWRWHNGKRRLAEVDLDVGAAANVVIMEYMKEKVQRAKRMNPKLRDYSDDVLLAHLLKGYQGQAEASA
jgi:hypothetical protein